MTDTDPPLQARVCPHHADCEHSHVYDRLAAEAAPWDTGDRSGGGTPLDDAYEDGVREGYRRAAAEATPLDSDRCPVCDESWSMCMCPAQAAPLQQDERGWFSPEAVAELVEEANAAGRALAAAQAAPLDALNENNEPRHGQEFPRECQGAFSAGYIWGQRSMESAEAAPLDPALRALVTSLRDGAYRNEEYGWADQMQNILAALAATSREGG